VEVSGLPNTVSDLFQLIIKFRTDILTLTFLPWATWYSSCGTWWHTRRNQISSFPETDESI